MPRLLSKAARILLKFLYRLFGNWITESETNDYTNQCDRTVIGDVGGEASPT